MRHNDDTRPGPGYENELIFGWEGPAFTRKELVREYARVERRGRWRERLGPRCWVDVTCLPDGREEHRRYEAGQLVDVRRIMPAGIGTTQRGHGDFIRPASRLA